MKPSEAEIGKHTESTEDFWQEIERQFGPMHQHRDDVWILSPKQTRAYQLAVVGVPKYQIIFEKKKLGYRFIPVPVSFFEEFFLELYNFGLIDLLELEELYKSKLPPSWISPNIMWDDLINRLKLLVEARSLTQEFAQLWNMYQRQLYGIGFVALFEPYKIYEKSIEENITSIVERYIYALWMTQNAYDSSKRNKGSLGFDLSNRLDEAIFALERAKPKPWYLPHYKSLMNSGSANSPLLRSATDMTPEEIKVYANDGLLNCGDFPEIFSVP